MDRDAIERLAIDSAAGELNEDTEVLFQFFLAGNPQAKRWAEDVRQVYDKTESAIQTKTALAGDQKIAPRITSALRVKWLPVARWAAAIVLGSIIGFTAGRWEVAGETHRIAFQELDVNPKPVETVTDLKEKYVGTFWGDKMLALLEQRPDYHYKVDLHDIRSWGTYRQYIKEKQNE